VKQKVLACLCKAVSRHSFAVAVGTATVYSLLHACACVLTALLPGCRVLDAARALALALAAGTKPRLQVRVHALTLNPASN